jgi:hypothetical protein
VAGLVDQFIKGAVGSLAKDKITNTLTPTQMELASFILNPQYYMAEKGINKIADILGYGSDYKNVQADAKANNQYYKELMRDALGNVLPDSIGNIIRSNPKISEADLQPAGEYIAWDPATESWTRQGSPRPVSRGTSETFDDFLRDLNAGDSQTVGPLEEYDQKRLDAEYDFQTSLSDFQPGLNNDVNDLGEVTVVDQKPADSGGDLSYTEMLDILNSTPSISASRGLNVPGTESVAPTGFTYDPNLGMNAPATEILAPAGSVYDASIGANTPITDSLAPTGYTFDVNTGTVVPATDTSNVSPAGYTFDAGNGMNVPEAAAPEGYTFDANTGMNEYLGGGYGGGGKYYDDFSSAAYVKGGQIYRGRR